MGFPTDDLSYGFDNTGDTAAVSTLHLEKYAAAARRVAEIAIAGGSPATPARRLLEIEDFVKPGRRVRSRDGHAMFTSRARVVVPVDLPRTGEYLIRIRAFGDQAGKQPARMALGIDGGSFVHITVPNERRNPRTFEKRLWLEGGRRLLSISFINDYYDRSHPDRRQRDRNLWVDYLDVVGPVDRRELPASHKRLFARDRGSGQNSNVVDRARPILEDIMQRAWRRPARRTEVTRLCRLAKLATDDGDTFEQGIQLALQAVLVSPNFLFRIEPGGFGEKGGKTKPLDGWAIATRLSYFLWSSTPDNELLQLAADDKLADPKALDRQVQRMLDDKRADALAENFAAQWLELRLLEDATPDPKRFPAYSTKLRNSMWRETVLFFRAVLRERRSVLELIDADFTFLDERLARHYSIRGVSGEAFRRVQLKGPRRGGLISHASIHTITSNPTRTSPVKRGKWILENLLDDPPPPPAPGFDSFKQGSDVTVAATLRQQLALHREKKVCASCHNRMDPLGLSLENYDAIGRWRDTDHGTRIDASGELPGGEKINGPVALKKVLVRGDAFLRCLAKKLFIYAVGREVRGADEVVLDSLVRALPAKPGLADMIRAIVQLDAFRRRSVVR